MIIVPKRNLYLPPSKWGQRRFQRGIIMVNSAYAGGGCTAGTSTIPNLNCETASGTTARTGGKWDSDGINYTRVCSSSFSATGGAWKGSCANSLYEGRWTRTGDAPTTSSGAEGVYHAMTTDVMVGYDTPNDDLTLSGTFTFELRLISGGGVILTEVFSMTAFENPPD